MIIKSRPTTYAGARFRSRLEARWAAFFDLLNWRWEYEPIDAEGWVPDFLLIGKARAVPVEVKPITWGADRKAILAEADERPDLEKARRTEGEILVLGLYPFFLDYREPALGVLLHEEFGSSDLAILHGGPWDFRAEQGSYELRLSGEHDGDHHLANRPADWGGVGDLWRKAGAATQWRGR